MEISDEAKVDQFTPPEFYQIHVILEATDDGTPRLTRYRRAIITVPGAPVGTKPSCAVSPVPPAH